MPQDVSRILVIRPGGIGDAVFLLPVFKSIKLKFPHLRIDVLCQKRNAPVFSSQKQWVDRVLVFESPLDLKSLLDRQYDVIADTEQWHYLSALTALTVKASLRTGFASRPLRGKLFNRPVPYDHEAYELRNFALLFEGLTEAQDRIKNIDNCFMLTQSLRSWAERQIPPNSVMVFAGGSVPERRLSQKQLVTLIKGILKRGFCAVLLGGKDVLSLSRRVLRQVSDSKVYDFIGKISLHESAALIKAGRIFIGTDSGVMHLACAVGSPVIALFGAGNMKKWMDSKQGQNGVREDLPCSPCTAFGYGLPVCRGAYSCLRKMDLDAILDKYLPAEAKNV